jgi:dienelactone hydrolase
MMSLLCAAALAAPPTDWPALLQKPYAGRPVPAGLGLVPLPAGSKDEWEAARAKLRAAWLERLGTFPAPAPALDLKIVSTENRDGYRQDLVSFASEGDDRIAAYLLTPAGLAAGGKRPAVVVFHSTTRGENHRQPAGVAGDPELALARDLARRGYVALAPECYIMKAGGGRANIMKQVDALAARRPGLTGMGKMTFDASRCVDFLASLPAVDVTRVGCIGFSLGSKEVLYALAFEPRYKAGVANEGGVGVRMSNYLDPWYLTEAFKPHVPALEHHQLLGLAAPRPVLVMGGDSADGDASWPFVASALPVYRLLGGAERVGVYNHKGGHTFPKPARELAYRWLDEALGHAAAAP